MLDPQWPLGLNEAAGAQQRVRVKKEAAAQRAREAEDGLVVAESIVLLRHLHHLLLRFLVLVLLALGLVRRLLRRLPIILPRRGLQPP